MNTSVELAPVDIEAETASDAVGNALIVIEVVVAVALPQLFVAVKVYAPADKALVTRFAGLKAELKLLGPLHE